MTVMMLEMGGLRLVIYSVIIKMIRSKNESGIVMKIILPDFDSSLNLAVRFCILFSC